MSECTAWDWWSFTAILTLAYSYCCSLHVLLQGTLPITINRHYFGNTRGFEGNQLQFKNGPLQRIFKQGSLWRWSNYQAILSFQSINVFNWYNFHNWRCFWRHPLTGRRERFQSPPLKSQSALLTLPQRPNFAHIWKEREKKIKVLKRILKFSFSLHCHLLRGSSSLPPYSSLIQVFYKDNYSCYR